MLHKLFSQKMSMLCRIQTEAFCKSKDYFESKKIRQSEHLKTTFHANQQKLRDFNLNLKVLVPNFFTKTMPIKEYEPTPILSKDYNTVQNSFIRLQIPIKSDKEIQNSLVRLNTKYVRVGRIMQCMDSIAGIVGYKHCFGSLNEDEQNPFVLVTACVDKIDLIEPIDIHDNIVMQGFVNYVGRTSMEIGINLYQNSVLKADALFTMVSRNAKDHTKSYPCPKLQISHLSQVQQLKAELRLKQAIENVQKRKVEMKESYKIKPPSQKDTKIIHDIFLNLKQVQKNAIDINSTLTTMYELMHVQQRNIHNKIFGGFLMRQMVQSGLITAYRFAGHDSIWIQDITDIYFKEPVEVGCVLKIQSRISYTNDNFIVVTIEASTRQLNQASAVDKLCCHMHMFIKSEQDVSKVFPKSYQDGIYYLTSKNAYQNFFCVGGKK